jgi:plasmid stabilization system protein ParE
VGSRPSLTGLPSAAAGYYFATSQELIEAALMFHVQDRAEAVVNLLRTAAEDATSVPELGRRISTRLVQGTLQITAVRYEVYLEATRNQALRDVIAGSMAAFEAAVVPLLSALGLREPEQAARAFNAVTDGFDLHRIANPSGDDDEIEMLYNAIAGLFIAYTTDPAELDERLRDHGKKR